MEGNELVHHERSQFTKKDGKLSIAKNPEKIMKKLERYGPDKAEIFQGFIDKYGL